MADEKTETKGFTLVELLVAIAISSLALIILTRLFSVSLNSYNAQEQLADMNQNARYTIKELSDILMQAGADLQIVNLDTLDKDTVIIPDGNTAECTGFTIKLNPRGGIHEITQTTTTAIDTLYVRDAREFRHADSLQRIPGLKSSLSLRFYTIQHLDTVSNYVVFSPTDNFIEGDAVCSFIKRRYFLNNTDLCIDDASNIVAENIDSLSILFLDRNGNPTARWARMRSVQLLVRAKTARPDNRYTRYADHCHRVTLTYKFRLRNKVEI